MSDQHHHDSDTPAHSAGSTLRTALQIELLEHAPFSVSSVTLGLIFAGLICYIAPQSAADPGHDGHGHAATSAYHLFHLFHPSHMFFSAAATTAMFWRYDHHALKAILVGLAGAVGVCGVSDIALPHLALVIMNKPVAWHICVIENPGLVLPFAVMGVLVGLAAAASVARSTLFSHSLHVLASTMASIFYLIAPFSRLAWFDDIGRIFVFVIVAVMLPCCASDIVFPLLMTKEARARAASHTH